MPIVGKAAGAAAEYFGDKVGHALGRETTAEALANIEKTKKALSDYETAAGGISDRIRANKNAADVLGLSPGDAEIEKAKQKYREALEKIHEDKQTTSAGGSAIDTKVIEKRAELEKLKNDAKRFEIGGYDLDPFFTDADQSEANDKVAKAQNELRQLESSRSAANGKMKQLSDAEVAIEKARDAEIAAGQLKRIQGDRDFNTALTQLSIQNQQEIAATNAATLAIGLGADNRAYEAKVASLKAELTKETDAIKEAGRIKLAELQKQEEAQRLLANQGNAGAGKKAKEISEAMRRESLETQAKIDAAKKKNDASVGAERQNTSREDQLAVLRMQGDAGSVSAKLALERLNTSREQDGIEKSLLAIANDAAETDTRRAQAKKDLAALAGVNSAKIDEQLRQNELSILEKQAALGDVTAGYKLEQLRISHEQLETETKLKDLRDHGNTQQRRKATTELEAVGKLRDAGTDNAQRDAGIFVLQQEAALGDKLAEQQLKKIELERKFGDERKKALAVLEDSHSNEKQKTNAHALLSSLDAVQKRAMEQLGGPDRQDSGATLVDQQHITGKSASIGQERDQYAPIVAVGEKHIAVSEAMKDMLKDFLDAMRTSGRPKPLT